MRSLLQGGSLGPVRLTRNWQRLPEVTVAPAAVPPALVPARPSPRFQRAQSPAPGPLPSPRLCCLASTSFSSSDIRASRACVRNACSGQARPPPPAPNYRPCSPASPTPRAAFGSLQKQETSKRPCARPREGSESRCLSNPPFSLGDKGQTHPMGVVGGTPSGAIGVTPWLQAVGLCPTVLKNLSTVSCLHVSPCHSG